MNLWTKLLLVALGSSTGSAVVMAFVPPSSTRDGWIKGFACAAFSAGIVPALVAGLVRLLAISPAAVPDVLFAMSVVVGLCSQWIINALINVSRSGSESLNNNTTKLTLFKTLLRIICPWVASEGMLRVKVPGIAVTRES